MEYDTVATFTELAYKTCVKLVNDKNKSFILHDEQRLQNCFTRFVESYNVTSEQFFLKKADATTSN